MESFSVNENDEKIVDASLFRVTIPQVNVNRQRVPNDIKAILQSCKDNDEAAYVIAAYVDKLLADYSDEISRQIGEIICDARSEDSDEDYKG